MYIRTRMMTLEIIFSAIEPPNVFSATTFIGASGGFDSSSLL